MRIQEVGRSTKRAVFAAPTDGLFLVVEATEFEVVGTVRIETRVFTLEEFRDEVPAEIFLRNGFPGIGRRRAELEQIPELEG